MKDRNLRNSLLCNGLLLALLFGGTTAFAPSLRAQEEIGTGAEQQEPPAADVAEDEGVADEAIDGTSESLYAVVDNSGTIVRELGVFVRPTRVGLGRYEVKFRRKVRNCAYIATIGVPDSTSAAPSGEISVAGRSGGPRTVYVRTFNSVGAPADRGFHLVVVCRQS